MRVIYSSRRAKKMVLILLCIFPDKIFVACGGKNNLRNLDKRYILLPDTNAIQEWLNKAGRAIPISKMRKLLQRH